MELDWRDYGIEEKQSDPFNGKIDNLFLSDNYRLLMFFNMINDEE